MWFWLQISICQAVWWTKAVEGIARQGLETLKHQQSAEEKPQDGYNCPASMEAALDRICPIAVKNLVLSQEDKPKRHRSAR